MPQPSRLLTIVLAAALLFLAIRHGVTIAGALPRTPEHDESEYLHSAWLMHEGRQLYRDFVEDHTPFLLSILARIIPAETTPEFPRLDLPTLVTRARLLMAFFGLLAVATLAILAYRGAGSLLAPVLAIAAIIGSELTRLRGLLTIRNDPPALALFWIGAALLLIRWRTTRARAIAGGLGIGLVAVTAVWNPKWPLESITLGVLYLVVLRDAWRTNWKTVASAVIPPIVCVTGAAAWLLHETSLRDYYFFSFRYNALITDWFMKQPGLAADWFANGRPYFYCDAAFKGPWPILGILGAISVLALRRKFVDVDRRLLGVMLAFAIGATIEIRFIYPYPNVWPQYYLMWSFSLACLYAIVACAFVGAIASSKARAAIAAVLAIGACALVQYVLPPATKFDGWVMRAYLQQHIRPGETVWVSADVHPIGIADASYYWFSFKDLVAFSVAYSTAHRGETPLPAISEKDLPICRAERGLQPDVRFVSGVVALERLPENARCLDRMLAAGRAVRTPVRGVFDLKPDSAPTYTRRPQ